MKVKFNTVLNNLAGEPMDVTDADGKKELLTLGYASVNALLTPYADEPNLPGPDKIKRGLLAERVYKADKSGEIIDVSAEDVALIKHLLAKAYAPLGVLMTHRAIEGHDVA